VDKAAVESWVEGYRRAWESNDPEDIARLFSEDGRYYTEPYATPWTGRDGIVSGWLDGKDKPGDTEFSYETLVVTDDVGIVQGETRYRSPPRTYSNLWVVRLDRDERCTEFTEWWMKQE
jgi:uncharacterized protein (TIGR02246 family)